MQSLNVFSSEKSVTQLWFKQYSVDSTLTQMTIGMIRLWLDSYPCFSRPTELWLDSFESESSQIWVCLNSWVEHNPGLKRVPSSSVSFLLFLSLLLFLSSSLPLFLFLSSLPLSPSLPLPLPLSLSSSLSPSLPLSLSSSLPLFLSPSLPLFLSPSLPLPLSLSPSSSLSPPLSLFLPPSSSIPLPPSSPSLSLSLSLSLSPLSLSLPLSLSCACDCWSKTVQIACRLIFIKRVRCSYFYLSLWLRPSLVWLTREGGVSLRPLWSRPALRQGRHVKGHHTAAQLVSVGSVSPSPLPRPGRGVLVPCAFT